jgi:hypothetical protein
VSKFAVVFAAVTPPSKVTDYTTVGLFHVEIV